MILRRNQLLIPTVVRPEVVAADGILIATRMDHQSAVVTERKILPTKKWLNTWLRKLTRRLFISPILSQCFCFCYIPYSHVSHIILCNDRLWKLLRNWSPKQSLDIQTIQILLEILISTKRESQSLHLFNSELLLCLIVTSNE